MAGGKFGGGTGASYDPYLIEDADDLNMIRMRPNVYYKLISNINLGVYPYNTGKGWTPISNFTGNFDGNGKKIFNLYINRPQEDYIGLFASFSSSSFAWVARLQIKDLILENVDIIGRDCVGAIVGQHTLGDVRDNQTDPTYCQYRRCVVQGNIKGRSYVGGLSGYTYWGCSDRTLSWYWNIAEDCCVDVKITPLPGGKAYGLFIGFINDYHSGSYYKNIYMHACVGKGVLDKSNVTNPALVGILGYHTLGARFIATDCRYDKTTWNAVAADATGLTSAEMKDPAKFAFMANRMFNGIPIWTFFAGEYPRFVSASRDYLFVNGDDGYYTYSAAAGWTRVCQTVPSRQQAIEKGMRLIENIPQAAWEYFKTHSMLSVVNIMDRSEAVDGHERPLEFVEDVDKSSGTKKIYRKTVNCNTITGNFAAIKD